MDELNRREFLKIASAAGLLLPLGICGCRRPEELIAPFSKPISEAKPGEALYYATAMQSRMSALPLLVKTVDYHPVKIEGNPEYPGGGSSNRYAQVAIYGLYDPLRSSRFLKNDDNGFSPIEENEVWRIIEDLRQGFEKTMGDGLCILTDQSSSPSRERLFSEIKKKYPNSRWFEYEPVNLDYHNKILSEFFGEDVAVVYNFKKASVILSLDCDFLDSEEDSVFNSRGFAAGRTPPEMNRLYCVESCWSLTGANADYRLAVKSALIQSIAAAVGLRIFQKKYLTDKSLLNKLKELSDVSGNYSEWIERCVSDLMEAARDNKKKPLVVCGYRQPPVVHLITMAINAALGSIGNTVFIKKRERISKPDGSLDEFADFLKQARVKTLIISRTNPAYAATSALDWDNLRRKAATIIRLGLYEDETSQQSHIHIPLRHFLECWGDARCLNGDLLCVQPAIQPIWKGVSELGFFARLAGSPQFTDYDIARQTFKFIVGDNQKDWENFLRNGFVSASGWKDYNSEFDFGKLSKIIQNIKPIVQNSGMEFNIYRSAAIDDGRHFTNVWLQETADPITKVVWDNTALVSPETAKKLGLEVIVGLETRNVAVCPVVKIKSDNREIIIPVLVVPGIAEDVIGLTVGYGRKVNSNFGRLNFQIGTDVFKLRVENNYSGICKVEPLPGSNEKIARMQANDLNPDEDIIIECENSKFQAEPDFVKSVQAKFQEKRKGTKDLRGLYKAPELTGAHQWGMIIDLNKCIGCGACVVACRSENNIPVVGKEQVLRGREMDWLRIDRYFYSNGDVKIRFQPIMCMQCEAAPCEYVCPVNATVHNSEGLNLMVYNRCIGARYCMNNCPYRVRRFNYFDYNKRMIEKIYKAEENESFLNIFVGYFDIKNRKEEIEELIALSRNCSVTVRMRGVAEKCTFCIQRIQELSAEKKAKAGDSSPEQIEDGEVKTACEQACPAEAIVFGNLADPNSRVSKLLNSERGYSLFEYLNTKPRVRYLAKITNPSQETKSGN